MYQNAWKGSNFGNYFQLWDEKICLIQAIEKKLMEIATRNFLKIHLLQEILLFLRDKILIIVCK